MSIELIINNYLKSKYGSGICTRTNNIINIQFFDNNYSHVIKINGNLCKHYKFNFIQETEYVNKPIIEFIKQLI